MVSRLTHIKRHSAWHAACLLVILLLTGGLTSPNLAQTEIQDPGTPVAAPPAGIGDAWIVTGRSSTGCAEFDSTFDTFTTLVSATTYSFETVVSDGTEIYMDEFITTQPISAGDGTTLLYAANDRGLQTKSFPLPAGTPLTLSLTLYQGVSQTPVYRTTLQFTCNVSGYQVLSSGPLSPNLPVLNFDSLSGNGCQAGDLTLNLFATLDDSQAYLLDATVTNGSQVYMDYYRPFGQSTGPAEFVLTDANDRGLQTNQFPLPSSANMTVSLTLRSSDGRLLYESELLVSCGNSFSSLESATLLRPIQPALTLVDLVSSGCSSGQAQFENTLWIEQDEIYNYEILVQHGTNIYMDRYFATTYQDPLGYLPKPGINSFVLENANDRGRQNASFPLPPGTPAQVTFGLYDSHERPLYQTTFDYDCAQSGTVSNIQATAYSNVFLPRLTRP